MRKSAAVVCIVGLVLAALFAVGCGGDDDNGGGSATADSGGTTAANVDSGGGSDGSSDGSGAGSQSSGSGSNETDISKKEFIRKAEAICTEVSQKAAAAATAMIKDLDNPKAGFEELIERSDEVVNEILAPRYGEEIERIRALGYPSGDEAQIEAMLVSFEETIERAEEDPKGFSELNTVEGNPENPYEREDSLARRYGFEVCPRV